jgi:hypothetical protein
MKKWGRPREDSERRPVSIRLDSAKRNAFPARFNLMQGRPMPTDLEIAFPVLTPHDLATLATRGRQRTARAGDILYSVGDTSVPFFVVLDGDVEVLDSNGQKQ